MKRTSGFTLAELLLVVAIIGMLSSVIFASLDTGRTRAKTSQRMQELKSVKTALDMYAVSNDGKYPSTGGTYRSHCTDWGGYSADAVIPGLAPTYISSLPADSDMNIAVGPNNDECCYIYRSDANNYKLRLHNCLNVGNEETFSSFIDPSRDGGPNPYIVDGSNTRYWAIWSSIITARW